jgi:hypothetical protein
MRIPLAVCAAVLLLTAAGDTPPDVPKITLLYPPGGSVYDRTCRNERGEPADAASIAATVRQRSELQQLWDRAGPAYVAAVLDEIRLPFPYGEMQVTLTVCGETMSVPLMVNVQAYLPGAKPPAPPPEDFVEKVFHELMHHYVSPVLARSALVRKYEKESRVTQVHLHVMALEKLALEKLGKKDVLAHLAHLYETDPPPGHYQRAWRIVTKEGAEPFLQELKAVATP